MVKLKKMDATKKTNNAKILARAALKAMDLLMLSPKLARKGSKSST